MFRTSDDDYNHDGRNTSPRVRKRLPVVIKCSQIKVFQTVCLTSFVCGILDDAKIETPSVYEVSKRYGGLLTTCLKRQISIQIPTKT